MEKKQYALVKIDGNDAIMVLNGDVVEIEFLIAMITKRLKMHILTHVSPGIQCVLQNDVNSHSIGIIFPHFAIAVHYFHVIRAVHPMAPHLFDLVELS